MFNKIQLPKSFVILFFSISICTKLYSQGCIDTIVSKQFDVENFGGIRWSGTNYQDTLGNFYLLGGRQSFNPNINLKSTLIKFNNQKKIVWSKTYPGTLGFDDFALGRILIGSDKSENLYFKAGVNAGGVGNLYNRNFLKLDSSGNILASKLLRMTSNIFSGFFSVGVNTGKIFSVIQTQYHDGNSTHNVTLDKNLSSILWKKEFKPSFTNYISSSGLNGNEIDDTTLIFTRSLSYKNPNNPNDTIYTFNILKVNSLTGNIILQKSYSCFEPQNINKSILFNPSPRNIDYSQKSIIYQARKPVNQNTNYIFFTIDSNLNIINNKNYLTNEAFSTSNFNTIDSKEIILNANITQNNITKYVTINWDKNLQLIHEKLYASNQFVSSASYSNLTYKNLNNTFSYFISNSSFLSQSNNPIYLLDNTKNPNFEFDCTDKESKVFQEATEYIFRQDTASFISVTSTLNFQLINNPNTYTAQNNNFTESKYCDLISICTSLKVKGNTSFCLNKGNVDSFSVVRSSSCLRKTKWFANPTQMQILSSNDTIVRVKFLKPFKGYIKAVYENCNVADSLYIEVDTVYNMKTGVYLGKDTIQCIGKDIVLFAGDDFKSYLWQNGSTKPFFATIDTGRFYVTVKDSCSNVFSDTININLNPKTLALTQTKVVCEYDTAKFILPTDLTNYSWSPITFSTVQGYNLLLFPTDNTLYTIYAQSHNDCIISDTLLIKKKDCYASIYFPSAFTPNNDGLNDVFKPSTLGILQKYEITIFNRYGNIVFASKTPNVGWNGKYKNQIIAGGYTWMCKYQFRNKIEETATGTFVLLK